MKAKDWVRNNLCSKKQADGTYKSPSELLQNGKKSYSPKLMLPFGCFVIIQQPKPQRKGRKHPKQSAAWPGIFTGYGDDVGYGGCYLIWDPETRETHIVSHNYCTADESVFHWKTHPTHRHEWEEFPLNYAPTRDSVLYPEEFARYQFTPEEAREVRDLLLGMDTAEDLPPAEELADPLTEDFQPADQLAEPLA